MYTKQVYKSFTSRERLEVSCNCQIIHVSQGENRNKEFYREVWLLIINFFFEATILSFMFLLMSAINRLFFTYSLSHSHWIITLKGKSFPIHLLLSACIFCSSVSFLSWLWLETFSSESGALGVWLKPVQRMYCVLSERWHQFCCREPWQSLWLLLPSLV